jgi:hypothetical protein
MVEYGYKRFMLDFQEVWKKYNNGKILIYNQTLGVIIPEIEKKIKKPRIVLF